MTIIIREAIPEQSSAGFECALTDETETAMVPSAVAWTLTDAYGTVINARENVSITPASTVTIVLAGDDLAWTRDQGSRDATKSRRFLLVEATYNSDLGNALPFREEIRFQVTNSVGVT